MNDDKLKKLSAAKKKLKEFKKKQVDGPMLTADHNSQAGSEEHHSGVGSALNASHNDEAVPQITQYFAPDQYQQQQLQVPIQNYQVSVENENQNYSAEMPHLPPSFAQPVAEHQLDYSQNQQRTFSPPASNQENGYSSQLIATSAPVGGSSELLSHIEELKSYNVSLQKQILEEREAFGEQLQNAMGSLREQIQVHAQTIGILVGEKSQLQAALSQTKLAAETRQTENQELTARLAASRSRVADLEKQVTAQTETLTKHEKSLAEVTKQLEKVRAENSSIGQQSQELKRRHDDLQERYLNKESESSSLAAQVISLKNELQMTKVYLEQLSANASKEDVSQSQQLSSENERLKIDKAELERLLKASQDAAEALRQEQLNFKRRHETDLSGLEEHIGMLNGKIREMTREIEGHMQRNSQLETQLSDLGLQIRSQESSKHQLQEVIEKDEAQDRVKDQQLIALSQQLTQAKKDLEELVAKNVHFHQAVIDKDATIETLRGRLVEMEQASNNYRSVLASVEDVKTALSRALAQNAKLKQEFEELQSAFVRITNEKAELAEKLAGTKRPEAESNGRPNEAELKLEESQRKVAELELELQRVTNAARNHEACMKKITQLEAQISQAHARAQQIASSPEIHANCQEKIGSLEQQIEELRKKPDVPQEFPEMEEYKRRVNELETLLRQQTEVPVNQQVVADPQPDTKELEDKYKARIEELENCLAEAEKNKTQTYEPINMEAFAQSNRSEKMETVQTALLQLEDRFGRVMREKADLIDQKEHLEHLVIQLQSETDTIGEYITLYQKQRNTLKQQSEENARFMERLHEERKAHQKAMSELQTLVLKLVSARSQEPVRILSTGPDFNSPDRPASSHSGNMSANNGEENEWPDMVGEEASEKGENFNNSSYLDAPPVDPVSSRILQLLTAMTSSMMSEQQTNDAFNRHQHYHQNGLRSVNPDDNVASILAQMTPNTRKLVNQRLHNIRYGSPGECPCCKGEVKYL